jgi:hypothetical protein
MSKYQFVKYRDGSRYSISAATAYAALEEVRETNGELTPVGVVEHAEPFESPLHKVFEWDDEVAGYQYRLWQARKLIKAIIVAPSEADGFQSAYVHITVESEDGEGERQYMDPGLIVSEDRLYAAALEEARKFMKGAKRAFDELYRLRQERSISDARDHVDKASDLIAR